MSQPSRGLRQSTIKRNNDKNNPFNRNSQRRSYFDNQESKAGANWLMSKDDNILKKEAKGIIRDIVNQNVNIEAHGHYFTELRIIQALISECELQYKRWFVRAEMSNYYVTVLTSNRQAVHSDYAAANYEDKVLSSLYLHLYNTFLSIAQTQDASSHLINLYSWLDSNNGKYYMDDDIPEFVRNTYMDNPYSDDN